MLSPKWVTSSGLNFDDGSFFASVEGTYISDQYSTFMNDEVLPGYASANASIGYRFTSTGFVKKPQMQQCVGQIRAIANPPRGLLFYYMHT